MLYPLVGGGDMAQLTIYLDDETLKKIGRSARLEKESVSSWVKRRLVTALDTGWPVGYFDVFGSLKGTDFKRPEQVPFSKDAKRPEL
jgi:hypothetical protein